MGVEGCVEMPRYTSIQCNTRIDSSVCIIFELVFARAFFLAKWQILRMAMALCRHADILNSTHICVCACMRVYSLYVFCVLSRIEKARCLNKKKYVFCVVMYVWPSVTSKPNKIHNIEMYTEFG